jgi:hypothetical protein
MGFVKLCVLAGSPGEEEHTDGWAGDEEQAGQDGENPAPPRATAKFSHF